MLNILHCVWFIIVVMAVLFWLCVDGMVPGERWKTSNYRPLLEFTGHQPTLLYCSSRDFSFPAKCWCLKNRHLGSGFYYECGYGSSLGYQTVNGVLSMKRIFEKVVGLAAMNCLFLHSDIGFWTISPQHFCSAAENSSPFNDCNFLFIHGESSLHISLQTKVFPFRIAVCLSWAHMPCPLHASKCTCAHVPTPCSLPPQSLFLPLHAPYPSILFSLKPPHWPLPSNRMIIWHNVTPPDAWWGL